MFNFLENISIINTKYQYEIHHNYALLSYFMITVPVSLYLYLGRLEDKRPELVCFM